MAFQSGNFVKTVPATDGRLASLQILRIVAAMMVVLFHVGSGLSAQYGTHGHPFSLGYSGVDIFFVLSGFIISYTSRPERGILDFIVRRIARVVPLYWFLTAAVICLAVVAPSLLNSTTVNFTSVVKSLLFIPFLKENGQVQPILFLGWTLCYEMFFYLVFSLSLFSKSRYLMTCCILLIAIALSGAMIQSDAVLWRFFTNSIILEFVFGILLCGAYKHYKWMQSGNNLVAAILVSVGAFLMWVAPEIPRFLGHGIPALLIVTSFLKMKLPQSKVILVGVLLGDASYALYLAHPYIIQIPIKLLGKRLPIEQTAIAAFASVAVAILVSIVIFKTIEKPAQKIILKAAKGLLHRPATVAT